MTGAVAAVVLILVLIGGAAAWGLASFGRIDRVDVKLSDVTASSEPVNILVVGSDSRENITKKDPSAAGMLGKDAPHGQRADSLMIARVDSENSRVDLLSIPRDLWVNIAGKNKSQRINTAYSVSAQTAVDTIEAELDIPINHFIEVDFTGFRSLVDALGGVPMYFSGPAKDNNSGLNITAKGCHVLDGQQGLAFARSRQLMWKDGKKWRTDPTGDLGRMTRQQLLTRAAAEKAQTLGLKDVRKLKGLVDAAVDSVKLDSKWSAGDLLGMGRQFSDFDPQRIQTHGLPVIPFTTAGGAAVVAIDTAKSAGVLDLFRGTAATPTVTTTTVPPPVPHDVTVDVFNSSAPDGSGRRVSFVLSDGGFNISNVATGEETHVRTFISYPKGQKPLAELVAGWISPSPELRELKSLTSGKVVLDLGSDFDSVYEPSPGSPSNDSPESPSGESVPSDSTPSDSAGGEPGGNGGTPTTSPAVTTTSEPGWTPGVAPVGVVCR